MTASAPITANPVIVPPVVSPISTDRVRYDDALFPHAADQALHLAARSETTPTDDLAANICHHTWRAWSLKPSAQALSPLN